MNTGAIPYELSNGLVKKLVITLEVTERSITVAAGRKYAVVGMVKNVPISFRTLVANLDLLVVEG